MAQDNVQPVEGCRVAHRALDAFFAAYSPALGRYIPSRKLQVGRAGVRAATTYWGCLPWVALLGAGAVGACCLPEASLVLLLSRRLNLAASPSSPPPQFEYPDAYEAADAAPVGDDSNILKQPEHLAAEPAGGKRRKPRPVPGDGGRSFASP